MTLRRPHERLDMLTRRLVRRLEVPPPVRLWWPCGVHPGRYTPDPEGAEHTCVAETALADAVRLRWPEEVA